MSVHPLDRGRLADWGHRGPLLCPLDQWTRLIGGVVVLDAEEEEEEESLEEAPRVHRGSSMEFEKN